MDKDVFTLKKIIVERRHQLEKAESKRFPDDVQVNDISSRRKQQQDFLDILLQTRVQYAFFS